MGDLHEIGRFFLFTGAGFLAGLINTLASSGSAVTLPLLVFMGLPANVANGTNRVQLFIGRLASVVAFQRAGAIDWHRGLILCLPVLSGGIGGAYLASVISPDDIGRAITVAVFISLILILSSAKKLLIGHAEASPRLKWWHWPLFFLAGGWAGFVVLDSFT